MAERQPPQSFSFASGESIELVFAVDQVITGMTPRFAAKRNAAATAVLTTEGVGPTATATVTGTQECTVLVTDDNTESLVGTYRYAVEVEDGSGDKSEVAWGYLTFSKSMV